MTNEISSGKSESAWKEYPEIIKKFIIEENLRKVCDLGGGANPVIPIDFVSKHHLDYTIMDISATELEKAPADYRKVVQDITARNLSEEEKYDLVFTKMLAEHVEDGEVFHENIFSILNKGGYAIHFFPTLITLPFLINKLVPNTLADFLWGLFSPRDKYQFAKFPAHYSWCFGPIDVMLKRFKRMGYEVIEYKGFFGHAGYYKRIKPALWIHKHISSYLADHPNYYFTSYARVILKKA